MSDNQPPEWIVEYYDGDVPSILEDPQGPIHIEGFSKGPLVTNE